MNSKLAYLRARNIAQQAIHVFLQTRAYLHVETPILVVSPGTETHLQYFASEWLDFKGTAQALYLRSSPELHLKQALAMGADRVYHLGKCFRNSGELAHWHHPEFTMLEFYQTGISLNDFMDLTLELLKAVAQSLEQSGFSVSFPSIKPQRLTVFEAFERWTGITLVDGDPDLALKGRAKGYQSLQEQDDFETAYFKILLDVIEPELAALDLVFLYDYPSSQCALAKVDNQRAQRFELYFRGIELCNAFDELLDPIANRARIEACNQQRLNLGYSAIPLDEDFLRALASPIPSCCGNALGFDRMLALLLNLPNLNEVIPFRRNEPWKNSLR